jgi:uncharacterized membrane-anchored protein YjiN (DUF445 family)
LALNWLSTFWTFRTWLLKSRIGHISLIIAVSGLLLTEMGIHLDLLQSPFWRVLATGFEAGTIGALADWFAVSALFHRIPLPLIGRHTNIIVKNRKKLTEAIVELVTMQWLSAAIIHQKLEGVKIAGSILKYLQQKKNLDLALDVARQILLQLVGGVDGPQSVIYLKGWLNEQVNSADMARPLGAWLEKMVLAGEHQPFVDNLLKRSTRALDEPATRIMIHEKLKAVLASYEQQGVVKKVAVRIGKLTGGIDIDVLTDRLLQMIREMADEAESNPSHPLRKKLDETLMELSGKLKNGEEHTMAFIDRTKQRLLEDTELQSTFTDMVNRIKKAMEEQLGHPETVLMEFFKTKAATLIDRYGSDENFLSTADLWIKNTVTQLVDKYHHEVGNVVRENLLKLNDQELVMQIKEKVGDDLQYIRLNGAVVGGLVGILIAVVRLVILQ